MVWMNKARPIVACRDMREARALREIRDEMRRAYQMHGPYLSPHEGLGVITEEYDELKDEVKKKESKQDPRLFRKEAKQLASTGLRFMLDFGEGRFRRQRR